MATMTCARVRELASGFVLGALEPAEMTAVREHLDACHDPHPEVSELGGVVPYLGMAIEPVEPPASIKSAILAAAQADLTARRRSDEAAERLVATLGGPRRAAPVRPAETAAEPAGIAVTGDEPVVSAAPAALPNAEVRPVEPTVASNAGTRDGRVVPLRFGRVPRMLAYGVSIAAAVVLLIGTGMAIAPKQTAAPTNGGARETLGDIPEVSWLVTLYAPDGTTTGGQVYRRPSGNVVVRLDGLKPTTGTQVYVIWAVSPTGNPDRLTGGASQGGSALYVIDSPLMQTAKEVMVTLEAAPSSSIPTLPAILSAKLPN